MLSTRFIQSYKGGEIFLDVLENFRQKEGTIEKVVKIDRESNIARDYEVCTLFSKKYKYRRSRNYNFSLPSSAVFLCIELL